MKMTLEDLEIRERQKLRAIKKVQLAIKSLQAEAENEEYNLRWIQFYKNRAMESPAQEVDVNL